MKVRIYKSPDGNGKYLNKTGQFLKKAQKGKIVKNILQYGKQLVMNFDEADKIQKATELAKAIDKSNKAGRAAGAIKYGKGVKKATTASSKIQIKNPAFFQEVLNSSNLSPSTRKYHEEVIKAVIKNNNLATQSQYNTLQRIKNGTFPKYQLGGVPDVSEMGYPGSNSEEKKDLSQDELVNIIFNDLNNDINEQQIAFKLANFYDVDPMEAINLVSQVKNYLIEQNGSNYEYDFDEDKNEENEEDVVEEDVVEEEPYESQEEVDAAEDTQNSSFVTDMLLNEDEEEDDDEEKYGGQMAYGGLYKARDGEEVETEIQQNDQVTYPFNPTAPDIAFPEIETYLPYNMADMLNGNVDPSTGTYYNHYTSKDINQNSEYEDEDNSEEDESDISSEYALDAPPEMKMGGSYKKNKRIYVNSILKLAKKAEGGEEKKSDEDPEAGDPTGKKIRKQKLNNFISSLKKETEMFNLKQQAEQQYDQMMQQQQQPMPPQNQMMQNGGSREPRVVRGNELRYRANQLKDFITGQNRRDREDNIDYFNVNDYPTTEIKNNFSNDGSPKYGPDKDGYKFSNSTNPKIGQTYDDWWVTSTGNTPGFYPDNRKWNGKDWVSRTEYYGNSDYSNNEGNASRQPSYTLDVRKSNWLTGKPSKYRIDFYGYSPLVDIANGNNPGVISQKPVVNSSNVSTIVSTVNKSQSTDLPKQGTLLPHGFFTTDANGDKIPDYLQPGKFSTLPTGISKEVITQAAVSPNATVSNTPIISSVYKPEVKRNSSPTLIEIKKNNVTVPVNPIPKFTTTTKKKTTTNKTKKKSDYYYRDPTVRERFERFFDPNFENGGYVDSENPDLYEFNQGGYDPTQQDMDYSNSIDTTDPYFQRGGGVRKFIENYFPGNILSPQRTYRNEIQRVYDPRTGKTVAMPSNMGKVSSINVHKSRFWSGKPKKYTINFNGSPDYTVTLPDKNNNSSQKNNKQNNSQRSNVDGLGLQARMAIRKGERQNERNSRRLKRQGLDEYGNRPGDQQGAIYNDGRLTKDREGNWYDRNNVVIPGKKRPSEVPGYYDNNQTNTNEPMSNVEMLKKQGKIWDEKLNKWVNLEIPRLQPLPVGQIDIPRNKNNNWGLMPTDNYQNLYQIQEDINDGLYGESAELEDFVRSKIATPWEQKTGKKAFNSSHLWGSSDDVDNDPILSRTKDERDSFTKDELKNLTISPDMTISEMKALEQRSWNSTDEEKNYFNDVIIPKYNKITGKDYDKEEDFLNDYFAYYDKNTGARVLRKDIPDDENNNRISSQNWYDIGDNYITKKNSEISNKHNADVIKHKLESRKKRGLIPYRYLNKYGGYIPSNYFEYGGLTQMTVGGPPPCGPGEMLDPATNKCKAVSGVLKNNPPNGAPGSPGTIDSWGGTRAAMNPNIPSFANPGTSMKQMMGLDTDSMKSFTNPDGTSVGGNTNDPYSIDVENRRDKGKLAFGANADTSVNEARLQTFNAGVDVIDGIRKNAESRKRENEMYENLSSNNLYASDPSRDRGDYDTNSGLYRPDEQGQMWNSRSKQFGGYIDEEEYYDPYTEEDEEDELTYAKGGEKITYMSEDQIRAFMAEGGQVEFL
jgi:hypothetical protein